MLHETVYEAATLAKRKIAVFYRPMLPDSTLRPPQPSPPRGRYNLLRMAAATARGLNDRLGGDAMEIGRLVHRQDGAAVIATVYRTTNPWERLRGLLARPPLGEGQGMLIDPCGSIHTLFMGYPIDVVYLDRQLIVTRVVPALVPWRGSLGLGAAMTLELRAGGAAAADLRPGVALRWESAGRP